MSDPDNKVLDEMKAQQERLMHAFNSLQKSVDDILWYHRLGDIARIDKMRMTGPPPRNIPNPTAQGAGNPVVFWSYTFTPKELDEGGKYPLIVFPHGGVHSNMGSSYAHIIGELIRQGYLVVAPEYRGSTGYGRRFHRLIDYGGLEVEDTYAARNWMVENNGLVDPDRVGIMGWSHGGLHALMNVFSHPDDYKAAFAGVPVSDLVARMGYKTQHYRDLYSADYHIGKTAYEDVNEYRRRSPAWNAEKLRTPLLIHTNTTDEDVNVLEVEHLIKSLKAAGKDFQYKIFEGTPGGHVFDRLDTRLAREARTEIYRFLARYLSPPNPMGSP
jgi:dipeptidyl aminopeptidase/acylaminoacyl peptidase